MLAKKDFKKISDWLWEIPKSFWSEMKVPARIYVSEKMLDDVFRDRSLNQLVNLCCLPGIQKYGLAMPDCHEGYASPIGGVAAISTTEGIISPGMQGYDVNCTSSDAKILLENGIFIRIKDLEKNWNKFFLKYVDFKDQRIKDSSIIYFLKRYCNPHIYEVITEGGNKIKATEDHPIYTKEGMKEIRFLKKGEEIALYPFEGLPYEEPANETILSESSFEKTLQKLGKSTKGSAIQQILNYVKRLNILPLKYNSWQLPYFLKIMGYILGDGVISFRKKGAGIVGFYGDPEDLKEIAADIKKIGFNPSRIYQRERFHQFKTHYKEYSFTRKEYSIRVASSSFAFLLIALGPPHGVKTSRKYEIPGWIFKAPLWQKRLFLAALFGAELSSPKTLNKYNFYAPQLNMNKDIELVDNGKQFLNQIASLLQEFKVSASTPVIVKGYRYKGKKSNTMGLRLTVLGNPSNLFNLLGKIGYVYNKAKQRKGCLAVQYLKLKQRITTLRKRVRREALSLYKQGWKPKEIVKKLTSRYTPPQFIRHSIFTSFRGIPRIAFNFPSFEEYKRKFAFGSQGLVWEKIEKIESIPYADFVYDFTINNKNHNFIANNFVVSNCGMKLLRADYQEKEIRPHLEKLADEIQKEVPSGLGRGRKIKLSLEEIDKILEEGARYLVERGWGETEDIENCEAGGKLNWAEARTVSLHAKNRGRGQVGTLGSGNHFLEIQKVAEIFDKNVAQAFGLFQDQVVVMIHTGSRGLGHQVATDYIREFMGLMGKYQIRVPDREFACVPFNSPEGQRGLAASAAAANYAWANRQMIAHFVRKAWRFVLGEKASPLVAVYDVAHNIIKKENYLIDGKELEVAIHRKGATRAFPPGHPEIPQRYREVGQPVLIPGSMGTASYVLVGTKEGKKAFFSTCHGSGRTMSRHAAIKRFPGREVVDDLEKRGILVKCRSFRGIAEEAPLAYKNIDEVVEVVHQAGLSKKVAKLSPLVVIKGE